MPTNETDSEESSEKTQSIDNRLERIEQIVSGFAKGYERHRLAAKQWNVFVWIVGFHCAAVSIQVYYLDKWTGLGIVSVMFGLCIGSATTIAVWHGISLRPFFERWGRSLFATTAVLVSVSLTLQSDFVLEFLPILLTYFGAVVVCTRLLSSYTQTWLWAPDLPVPSPKPITIQLLLSISLAMALLLTFNRSVIGVVGSATIPVITSTFAFGMAQGVTISAFLPQFFWFQSVRGRCLVLFLLLAVNTAINLLAIFGASFAPKEFGISDNSEMWHLDGTSFFLAFLPAYFPSCFVFSIAALVSPTLTFFTLLNNGQKLIVTRKVAEQSE